MNAALDLSQHRILITGSNGVLGRYLLLHLKSIGASKILAPKRSELDLEDLLCTRAYIQKHKPSIVIHLAATVYGLGGNIANPVQALVSNTLINNNLFSALSECPPTRIFFASTVAAYSYPFPDNGLHESAFFCGQPHDGEYGYAMAKRHAYAYLKLLKRTSGTNFIYGIFTNLYGRYDRFNATVGHVIPSLITKAYTASQNSDPLVVWGAPDTTRDFMHAADAASAIIHLIKSEFASELVNISTGRAVSVGEVSEIIREAAGLDNLVFDASAPTGIKNRVVDNTLLTQSGFHPVVALRDGLIDLYDWYSSNRTIARS
jgi:GDP-L-fucose synthase